MTIKILIVFFMTSIFSQSYGQNSKTEMALYNIGLSSVFSGVGALINKKPNERWENTPAAARLHRVCHSMFYSHWRLN